MTQAANAMVLDNSNPEKTRNGDIDGSRAWASENHPANISPELRSSLNRVLEELEAGTGLFAHSCSLDCLYAESVHKRIMKNGLLSLLGILKIPESQSWADAMEYCRDVIQYPQDTSERAVSKWTRSRSDLCLHLMKRFGPGIVAAARRGCEAIAHNYYQGKPLSIAHVDKKANAMRFIAHRCPGHVFNPASSLLATACDEQTALCCSIVTSAWQEPEKAVASAMISHVAVSDDYHAFTTGEYETRIRMIALSAGVAYETGGQAVNVIADGAALQAVGTGDELTVNAVMAWRAVGGCTTPYSSYLWGQGSLEEGLVSPQLIMAMHDLLDWRSDTAAQNHENGVSAVYGLGFENAFHTYLEASLRRASAEPRSGVHAMAGILYLHFTSIRYGSYSYRGDHGEPCGTCARMLRDVTDRAGLRWEPKPPPSSFSAGEEFRQLSKRVVDTFEKHSLAQIGLSWLQYLIVSGDIWLFDVLSSICPLDSDADWV